MIIKELYVDLDGVLCDFNKRYNQLFKEPALVDFPLSNNAKAKKYKQEFKEFVEGNNFATLEPIPDFKTAVSFLNKVTKNVPTYILTSTATEEYLPEISKQKKQWLKKYDIHIYPIFVPGKRIKCFYSKPGRVLIDDTWSNIDQWNKMGGKGIHHKNWNTTIKEFNHLLLT